MYWLSTILYNLLVIKIKMHLFFVKSHIFKDYSKGLIEELFISEITINKIE